MEKLEDQFVRLKSLRQYALDRIEGISRKDLLKSPKGFDNSIAWNIGHIYVSTLGLTYGLASLEIPCSSSVTNAFKRGTNASDVTIEALDEVLTSFLTSIDQLEQDYNKGLFKSYISRNVPILPELTSIEDALKFVAIHEGIHVGYVMGMKRGRE